MTLSSPMNAPVKIKRIFEVSTVNTSPLFAPPGPVAAEPPGSPLGGRRSGLAETCSVVPSMIFNRACWTP